MKQENKEKLGYSMITYRVRLYHRHFAWLNITKELYSNVVEHFFSVLQKEENLLNLSDFLVLRALETKCIGTKEMKAQKIMPDYPLTDFPKIPLYFRRSAINTAIDLARKHAWHCKKNLEVNGFLPTESVTAWDTLEQCNKQRQQHIPMTLYKGMYQNFTETSIELKLFNGEKWVWVTYPFTGRSFPEGAERRSPVLVVEKKIAYLNVPVSTIVSDIRTVKERMEEENRICAVAFPDNDVLAVAVVLLKDGTEENCCYFRGGKQKEYQKKKILQQIQSSKKSRGYSEKNNEFLEKPQENVRLFQKIHNINQYYAHSISRQILNFCIQHDIKVIVVPHYKSNLNFNDKKFLKTDNYRWIGRAIIKKLKYKAFAEGIVVTSIRPYHISDRCSICGDTIRKYNEGHTAGQKYHGGKLFLCPNGHKGNVAWNSARNIGKAFLSYI